MSSDLHLSNIDLFKFVLSDQNLLTSTERLVMVGIFRHRNVHSFLCFPDLETIAANTALNRRTIQRAIKSLEASGELIRVKTSRSGKTGPTFYYAELDLRKAVQLSEDGDSKFDQVGGDYELLEAAVKRRRRPTRRNVPF